MLPPYPVTEPSARFRFAASAPDRRAELRDDAAAMAVLAASEAARFLVFAETRPVVTVAATTALFTAAAARRLGAEPHAAVFLGLVDGAPWFAAASTLAAEVIDASGTAATADLRTLAVAGSLGSTEYGALAAAGSLLAWHASHRFCPACGTLTQAASSGWKRVCPACGAEHFPRTDPVVIMLVEDGERCLLGRGPHFRPGMYSCLAGFVEPGETLEQAVRRETGEEAGIAVGRIAYFASEPWPFPRSLMIGVRAEAASTVIRRDPVELEDCRWVDRAELGRIFAGTHEAGITPPPPIAIAHHLLRAFVAG